MRRSIATRSAFAAACLMLFLGPMALAKPTIVTPSDAAGPVNLAAKEVRRYLNLRTDQLLSMSSQDALPVKGDVIFVAPDEHPTVQKLRDAIGGKSPKNGFLIKTVKDDGREVLVIAGDDRVATLHGAYRFAEHLGVSFGLAKDVIPDKTIELDISGFDEAGKPLLRTRGIFPFHDFPSGPDFWSTEDYMSFIGQLPKLGMNFFGLHTYPRWSTAQSKKWGNSQGPEPGVWIGLPQDVNADGTVDWAYPAYWAHTHRPCKIWGFSQRDTSKFFAGAARVFDQDGYGSNVFKNGIPDDVESSAGVFNRVGRMFDEAFTHADKLGVKTAIGTELPLGLEPKGPEVKRDWVRGMPPELKKRLKSMGKKPRDPEVVKQVYKGIFKRIKNAHPLDYYWLWSWEVWSNYGVSEKQIEAFERDMQLAMEARKEVNSPFQIAKAGWKIGTADNSDEFDDDLPLEVPIYGLWDQAQGMEELREERVKWAATWLEEDWGLGQPQFELNRIYNDVKAAIEKGSHGLIAKHWRARVLSMNVAAMKDLLWNYGPVGSNISDEVPANRDRWMKQFYREWASDRFGSEVADEVASMFYRLDKHPYGDPGGLPQALGWDGTGSAAPGSIMPNENEWSELKKTYAFVDEFAALRPQVKGERDRANFDYWVDTFKAFRLIGRYGTLRHDFQNMMQGDEPKVQKALKQRVKMARLWEKISTLEIQRITDEHSLGELAQMEMHNWYQLMMQQWDEKMTRNLGGSLPARANPSRQYTGEPLVRVMPSRTHLYRGEPLKAKAIVMGDPKSVTLHWRPLGEDEFRTTSCPHIARNVYRVSLPAQKQDFEYYVEATTGEGSLVFPAAAPELSRTVVVSGRSGPSSNDQAD